MPTVKFVRPAFTLDEIQALGRRSYAVDRGGLALPSERDQNVVLQDARNRRYVVKISNAAGCSLRMFRFPIGRASAWSASSWPASAGPILSL